jgi:hypothetical protein
MATCNNSGGELSIGGRSGNRPRIHPEHFALRAPDPDRIAKIAAGSELLDVLSTFWGGASGGWGRRCYCHGECSEAWGSEC